MTAEELGQLRDSWTYEDLGSIVKVRAWRTVVFHFPDVSHEPDTEARSTEVVLTVADPIMVVSEAPGGSVILTPEEVMAIPGAQAFIDELLVVIENKYALQAETPPAPLQAHDVVTD